MRLKSVIVSTVLIPALVMGGAPANAFGGYNHNVNMVNGAPGHKPNYYIFPQNIVQQENNSSIPDKKKGQPIHEMFLYGIIIPGDFNPSIMKTYLQDNPKNTIYMLPGALYTPVHIIHNLNGSSIINYNGIKYQYKLTPFNTGFAHGYADGSWYRDKMDSLWWNENIHDVQYFVKYEKDASKYYTKDGNATTERMYTIKLVTALSEDIVKNNGGLSPHVVKLLKNNDIDIKSIQDEYNSRCHESMNENIKKSIDLAVHDNRSNEKSNNQLKALKDYIDCTIYDTKQDLSSLPSNYNDSGSESPFDNTTQKYITKFTIGDFLAPALVIALDMDKKSLSNGYVTTPMALVGWNFWKKQILSNLMKSHPRDENNQQDIKYIVDALENIAQKVFDMAKDPTVRQYLDSSGSYFANVLNIDGMPDDKEEYQLGPLSTFYSAEGTDLSPFNTRFDTSIDTVSVMPSGTSKKSISFNKPIPSETTMTISGDGNIPRDWNVTVSDSGQVSVTAPASAKNGEKVTIPVVITYPDGSVDTVDVPVVVKDSTTLADTSDVSYNRVDARAGDSVSIKPSVVPEKAKFSANGSFVSDFLPDDAVKVDEKTGVVTIQVPDKEKLGDRQYVSVPIHVTYSDGSVDDVVAHVAIKPDTNPDPKPDTNTNPKPAPKPDVSNNGDTNIDTNTPATSDVPSSPVPSPVVDVTGNTSTVPSPVLSSTPSSMAPSPAQTHSPRSSSRPAPVPTPDDTLIVRDDNRGDSSVRGDSAPTPMEVRSGGVQLNGYSGMYTSAPVQASGPKVNTGGHGVSLWSRIVSIFA